ncbi:MAG: amidohydrolase family protein [bacterium]
MARKLLIIILLIVSLNSMSAQSNGAGHKTVLQNLNIINVIDGTVENNMDIVIDGEKIFDIVIHRTDWNNMDVQLIDLSGRYAIPGLIEGHSHISGVPENSLTLALKNGVTSIRDMGGDGKYLKELKDAVYSGELFAPDIYFSAMMGGPELILDDKRVKLSTPPSYSLGQAPWMRLVEDTSNIEKIIHEAKACGATGIKLYSYLSPDLCIRLSREAKRQNLKVWAHASVYPTTVEETISGDVDVISHVTFLLLKDNWDMKKDGSLQLDSTRLSSEKLKNIFKVMKEKNIKLDPTLSVFQWQIRTIIDDLQANELRRLVFSCVKVAFDYGIKISAGTDCPLPRKNDDRLMLHREIEMLVENVGLAPIDALQASTINNAEVIGIGKTHGSIEVGKYADMVILNDNPLLDIRSIENVKMVIKKGKIIQ